MVHLDQIPSAVPMVPDELGATYAWRKSVGWSAVGVGLVASGLGVWSLMAGDAAENRQSVTPAAYDAHKDAASQQTILGGISVGLGSQLGANIALGPAHGDPTAGRFTPGLNDGQVRW